MKRTIRVLCVGLLVLQVSGSHAMAEKSSTDSSEHTAQGWDAVRAKLTDYLSVYE